MIGLILTVGILYTLWLYYDFSRRSKMNFSEYDWGEAKAPLPNENNVRKPVSEDEMKSLSETLGIDCIGMECCTDGMIYDDNLRKCVSKTGFNNSKTQQQVIDAFSAAVPDTASAATAVPANASTNAIESSNTLTTSIPTSVPASVPDNAITTIPAHLNNYIRKGSEKGYCRAIGNIIPPNSAFSQGKTQSNGQLHTLESCANTCDNNKGNCTGFDYMSNGACFNWNLPSNNSYEIHEGSNENMGCWINKDLPM
jgi:hypothetical protein